MYGHVTVWCCFYVKSFIILLLSVFKPVFSKILSTTCVISWCRLSVPPKLSATWTIFEIHPSKWSFRPLPFDHLVRSVIEYQRFIYFDWISARWHHAVTLARGKWHLLLSQFNISAVCVCIKSYQQLASFRIVVSVCHQNCPYRTIIEIRPVKSSLCPLTFHYLAVCVWIISVIYLFWPNITSVAPRRYLGEKEVTFARVS